jgi:hypothetical protein
MSQTLSSKLTQIPWPALAAVVFALPLGSVLIAKSFVAGSGSAPSKMVDMPVATPPGAAGATPSSDGFELIAASQWNAIRDTLGELVGYKSPIGGQFKQVAQERTATRVISRVAPSPASAQNSEQFPSGVHLTSVMRLAIRGVVTPEIAHANARAVVGGKLRKVGQEAAPGWTIQFIDVAAGTMVVRNLHGAEHTLTLRKAELSEQRATPAGQANGTDLPEPMTLDTTSLVAPPGLLLDSPVLEQGAPPGP